MKNVVMVHFNPARIANGLLRVDRKFHLGMCDYAAKIKAPLLTVHPQGDPLMDVIEIALKDLPYRVQTGSDGLREAIAQASLVYGSGLRSTAMARAAGVPYIPILEYDLQTQIIAACSQVSNPARKLSRATWVMLDYLRHQMSEMRHAHSIHCNGYPIYDVAKQYNDNCLLYLDSRVSGDQIISSEDLEARLNRKGPLRLLYSGRYEPMKGALDAVKVAVEALKLGIDLEMHTYGQGSLMGEMMGLTGNLPIYIHDQIPYPELVKVSKTFDLFVCCHIQSDPSCTYLESMGAGLPIIGYANRMWKAMQRESSAGWTYQIGDVKAMAEGIGAVALPSASRAARQFALDHCYEVEHGKRIDAINNFLRG